MINDQINGRTLMSEFSPFWKAAEQMGALLLIHQARPARHAAHHATSPTPSATWWIGRSFASFVFGGVMDACPRPQNLSGPYGGGYTCFGIGRMDRGWRCAEARGNITKPPSTYLRRFYYDCLTHSEAALRLILDTVGADRVVLSTDWRRTCGSTGLWPGCWTYRA